MFRSPTKTKKKHGRMSYSMAKAVRLGKLDDVKKLITKYSGDTSYLNAIDEDGNTALLKALRYGHVEIAMFLLNCAEIDVNKEAWQDKYETKRYRCIPISLAISKGYIDIAKALLINPSINVNGYAFQGYTVLDVAILCNQTEMINLLLRHPNLDLDWLYEFGHNVFAWAHDNLSRASFNSIITHPSVALHTNGRSCVDGRCLTIEYHHIDVLQHLLTLPDFNVDMKLWDGGEFFHQPTDSKSISQETDLFAKNGAFTPKF